mmetsp:Transcript_6980/g.22440  ORF Transcript_6980/g.22440 Transcript_6980/m.22440 type:complete len:341 (+) Transcript_6980:51-1073(+)
MLSEGKWHDHEAHMHIHICTLLTGTWPCGPSGRRSPRHLPQLSPSTRGRSRCWTSLWRKPLAVCLPCTACPSFACTSSPSYSPPALPLSAAPQRRFAADATLSTSLLSPPPHAPAASRHPPGRPPCPPQADGGLSQERMAGKDSRLPHMASHRIGARVAGLSPAQLCAIIEAQAGASDAALRVAEEHAARLVEQPEWVLSEVLLSPDLAPHILAQLPTKEHAVKGTCRAWRRGWKETLKKRERPRLLVIGGEDGADRLINSLERYDPSTNEWEEEAVAPMPTARGFVRMAMLDGKLYAVGGFNDDDRHLSSVERYDPAANAWEAVAALATARFAHVIVVA